MMYRCPYCQERLGQEPPPKCPRCGHVMVVPRMREPNVRVARKRKIEAIWRECEQKKSELGGTLSPSLFRNPKFYMGLIVAFVVIGAGLFHATDQAMVRQQEAPYLRAVRQVDVLAEALGRYHFHTGLYPDRDHGLMALVRDPSVPQWDGPYINHLRHDPWDTPYVYEPSSNGVPLLLSCGADKLRGTSDDIRPDPARFDPGTAWTNGWVSADQRLPGVRILPSLPKRDGRKP